jgi:hypothetical protein
MMYDIAALQYYYGANFGNVGKNFTYSWNRSTGQEFINGDGQGEPLTDKVFETVWTGGATSTYDLSNFNDDAWLDMRPGQFMKFSNTQLNSSALDDLPEYAQGNVYNALLFNETRAQRSITSSPAMAATSSLVMMFQHHYAGERQVFCSLGAQALGSLAAPAMTQSSPALLRRKFMAEAVGIRRYSWEKDQSPSTFRTDRPQA